MAPYVCRSKIHWLRLFFYALSAVATIALSSCTKKADKKPSTVTFRLPSAQKVTQSKLSKKSTPSKLTGSPAWQYADPIDFSEIKCYGIAVEVPENATPGSCTDLDAQTVFEPAVLLAPIPAGSLLSLSVPSGDARNIIVFGFAADSIADCQPSSTQTPVASKLSAPRILGTKLANLAPGDVEVTIDVDFDTSTSFDTCSQWTDINTAPPTLPSLAFDLSTQSVSESAGLVTVGINLSEAASQSINLPFNISGSATGAGTDHDLAAAGNLVINAGATTASLTFNLINDAAVESSETVVISLQTPTGATLGTPITHTVTISDNDTPTISLANSNLSLSTSTLASSTSGTATLTIRDATNNPIPTASGHTVAFSTTGGTSTLTFGATTDNGNGTYTASFSGIAAGSATTLNATIDGSPVTSTLPTVTVTPGGISTSQSLITVASASISSGNGTTLTLTVRDANGNAISSGGATVVFTRSGGVANGTIGATTDVGNGTYTASFNGTTAGSATTINATINGVAVTGTLPTITVTPGAISTSQSTITVGSSSLNSGTSTTLTLTVRDANNNPFTSGGATVLFTKSGGTASGTISATTDNGNGTYTATFTATTAGTATTINATINAGAITGTLPTVAVTPGAISVSQSTITVGSASIVSGNSTSLTLTSRDSFGNIITTGGATVVFSHSGGISTGSIGAITDNGDGTYSASFSGLTAGTATTINATINGGNVTGTLPAITVIPGAASLTTSEVTATFNTIELGDITTVILTTKDAYGNSLTTGGLSVAFSQGGSFGTFGAMTDMADGTYEINFTGTSIGGPAIISATITGQTVNMTASINVTPMVLTVNPVYPVNGPKWNDYVSFGAPTEKPWNQTDTNCTGSETDYYDEPNGCVHAGVLREVLVPSETSCLNLTITDALGAFNWICDDSTAPVVMYSRGLAPGKGLGDLINGTNGTWFDNTVTVQKSGTTIGTSPPAAWWNNPIAALTSNPGALTDLNTPSTIYYINGNLSTYGLKISAPKIAVVTIGTATLSASDVDLNFAASECYSGSVSTSQMICSGNQNHLWIETGINGISGTYTLRTGVRLYGSKFSRIHRTNIKDLRNNSNTMAAVELETGSMSNLITDLSANGVGKQGGLRISASNNIVRGLSVARNRDVSSAGQSLVVLTGSANGNRLISARLAGLVTSGGTSYGLKIFGSNNAISDISISNIGSAVTNSGIYINGGGNNIITRATISSTSNAGIEIDASSGNVISHVTTTLNSYNGLYINGAVSNNLIHNFMSIWTDKSIQANTVATSGTGNYFHNIVAASNGGGIAVDLASVGGSFNGFFDSGSGTPPTCSGGSFGGGACPGLTTDHSTAFVGKVVLPDAMNTSDTSGVATYSNTIDWLNFANPFRAWGKDHANLFPDTIYIGPCITGSCRIFDWRLTSGSPLQNKSVAGNVPNNTFLTGSNCPAQLDGSMIFTSNGINFLKYAFEISDDDIGNNNGLCESNEACIYTPNIGSFQGEGDYKTPGTCTFTSGTVGNVQIYGYPITGI